MDVDALPYLTRAMPGLGGRIKAHRADFVVEEIPLYEPSGQGTHVYFVIEKSGLPTMQAVHQIAQALGVPARNVGFAGLKDADAVTTQTLSLEHVDPGRIQKLALKGIRVLSVAHHTNKLKLGHLKGNRFRIRLRDVDTARISEAHTILDVLVRRGAPNYFGPQRFGLRGDTWQVGRALLCGDYAEALACMLGRPTDLDRGEVRRARALFDAGDYAGAADAWPYPMHHERRVCRAMAKTHGNAARAVRGLDKHMRQFFVSAFQSQLFNQVVARRIDALDRLEVGDLAWRHPQGAVFSVENLAAEQPRCDVFEISPTGPLYGAKMQLPTGPQGEIERAVLTEAGLTLESWRESRDRKARGGRRPLRFQPHAADVTAGQDAHGDYLELTFELEAGCYATMVLREICKKP